MHPPLMGYSGRALVVWRNLDDLVVPCGDRRADSPVCGALARSWGSGGGDFWAGVDVGR